MKNTLVRVLCVLALLALVSAACGGAPKLKEQLIGKWQFVDSEVTVTFDFQEDGKLVLSSGDNKLEVSYSWEDADTIKMVMTANNTSDEGLADVKIDGDTLTLTIDGQEQVLTRIK